MALANYTDLQAAVAAWINRTDLTSVIPDFVLLCEADLNRRLRARENEKRDTSFSASSRYTALPTDFARMKRVVLSSPRQEIEPLSSAIPGGYDQLGTPKFYSINGNQLELLPYPTAATTLELTYYRTVLPLSGNSTTTVLTAYPDLYLFGTCMQAGLYLNDKDLVEKFLPMYETALTKANSASNVNLGGIMSVRAA